MSNLWRRIEVLEGALENCAFDLRSRAEAKHGCSIGFEPWHPCTCPDGAEAGRLWKLSRKEVSPTDPRERLAPPKGGRDSTGASSAGDGSGRLTTGHDERPPSAKGVKGES